MLDALDLCSVAGFEGWSRWDSTHHHVRSHRFRDLDAARAVEDASLGVGRLRQMDILYLALACCPTIEPIQIALIISSHFPRCSQTVLDPSPRRPQGHLCGACFSILHRFAKDFSPVLSSPFASAPAPIPADYRSPPFTPHFSESLLCLVTRS